MLVLNKNVTVYTDEDRVVLRIDQVDIFIPYAQIFRIAQNIRLCCKSIKGQLHERARWDELAQNDNVEVLDYSSTKPLRQIKGKFGWEIRMDSECILLCLGDLMAEVQFVDGLQLSQLMRVAGKKAARWAGDTTAHKNAMGILTNAEDNYRLGI